MELLILICFLYWVVLPMYKEEKNKIQKKETAYAESKIAKAFAEAKYYKKIININNENEK